MYRTGVPFTATESHAFVDRGGPEKEEGWFDFVYQPLLDANGKVMGVLQQGIDVTARMSARQALERAREAAESASRAKGEFLAVMSHELRTPLNAIGGYVELLEGGYRGHLSPDQLEDLGRIRKSQRHLMGLINDLLNFTRIGSGSVRMDIADVAIHEILATCEALIVPQLSARDLTFSVEACDPSLRVHADRERVQQIVLNLLTNAIKFTPSGGRIDVRCAPGSAGRACIVIRDTGIGIPQDQVKRIFDPFVQVDARFTRSSDGIGLGLTISRDLAQAMGGDVSVESTLGEGSTFTLELPRG